MQDLGRKSSLAIIMVGIPARGKTFYARKISRAETNPRINKKCSSHCKRDFHRKHLFGGGNYRLKRENHFGKQSRLRTPWVGRGPELIQCENRILY